LIWFPVFFIGNSQNKRKFRDVPHNHVLHTHKDSENGGTHGGNQAAINVMFYVFNPNDLEETFPQKILVTKFIRKVHCYI
jgi:hypothetical protein